MAFDLVTWKEKVGERLQDWRPRAEKIGSDSLYLSLSLASLWPLAEATRGPDGWGALGPLFTILSGVGTNLLATMIQNWKDEGDAAASLQHEAASDPALQAELDAVLEGLETLALVQQALAESDRDWFEETLQKELAELGSSLRIDTGGGAFVPGKVKTGGGDFVGRDQKKVNITAQQYYKNPTFQQITTIANQDDKDGLKRRYLEIFRRQCQALPLAAMGGEEGGDADVTLDQVYIDLDTTTMINLQDGEKKADRDLPGFRDEKERPVAAIEAFEKHAHLALLGDPGSGKSTFVRHLQAWQAAAMLGEVAMPPPGCSGEMLPVQIMLRDLVPHLSGLEVDTLSDEKRNRVLAGALRNLITENLSFDGLERYAEDVHSVLAEGNCFLVLDGLDEVPQDLRPVVRLAVGTIISLYKPGRMVVTCRVRSYIGNAVLPAFQAYMLAPFNEDKIRRFSAAWYYTQVSLGRMNVDYADERAGDLFRAASGSDLRELSSNPMMLTTMAIIHQNEIGLPSERVRLYALAVDVLLRRWQRHRVTHPGLVEFLKDDLRLRAVVERLGYEAHATHSGDRDAADLARGRALTILEKQDYLGDTSLAAVFLDYVDQHTGLLVGRGGGLDKPVVYSFPHRTFQEYLAGCFAIGQRNLTREFFGRAGEGDDWALAAQLGFEELYFNRRGTNTLLDLAYRLCPGTEPADEQAWRAGLWSGQIAALVGQTTIGNDREDPDGGACYLARLLPRLATLLGEHLPAVERALAGNLLASLGDPRFDAEHWYLPDDAALGFVEIPAGEFLMGSDKDKDSQMYDDETPQHNVDLEAFYMARFPVTVAQFRVFVEENGFRPGDEGCLRGISNHPVVRVSWHEALKYCEWLNEKLSGVSDQISGKRSLSEQQRGFWQGLVEGSLKVSLPSEAEWEKAARGTDGRIYPWGDTFDADKANISETGIGSTTAAGCFVSEASPNGLQDMSGNVWEWTRSVFQPYPYDPNDGREDLKLKDLRVLRGGSFYVDQRYVRCAYRGNLGPHLRYYYRGFRVVVSPSSSHR
jgi:formylglycine-generating enzyme required for sulfatase activity